MPLRSANSRRRARRVARHVLYLLWLFSYQGGDHALVLVSICRLMAAVHLHAGTWQAALPAHLPLPFAALATSPQIFQLRVVMQLPAALVRTGRCLSSTKWCTGLLWESGREISLLLRRGKTARNFPCPYTHLLICPLQAQQNQRIISKNKCQAPSSLSKDRTGIS